MDRNRGGDARCRRWGRLLVGAACAGLLAGCASNGRDARLPPDQCSRAKARPANPHGSVLAPPAAVSAVPDDVMIFGNGADPAPARSAPAGEDLGRPIGMGPGDAGTTAGLALSGRRPARYGSC